MLPADLKRYADLLLDYSLSVTAGNKIFVQSTTLGEPLIQYLYQGALERQAIMEFQLTIDGQEEIYQRHAHEQALRWISPLYAQAIEGFDAYLFIRAPFEIKPFPMMPPELTQLRRDTLAPLSKLYNERTAARSLRRCLCQFPTTACAKEADMSLSEYEDFVLKACFLHTIDPQQAWLNLSNDQRRWTDYLNQTESLHFRNEQTDIRFSVKGRTWINSDGMTNMPSGEIYTSPIEDSVQGHIYFDYPFTYQQRTIQGVYLQVINGEVVAGTAEIGDEILKEILAIPGARRFGEVAIGTNPYITRSTKNILFDEKMSGTVHMALGQSYLQCGGQNESAIHQDMIADMTKGGQIWADDRLIYENGKFI
jgi:aminopeptidase